MNRIRSSRRVVRAALGRLGQGRTVGISDTSKLARLIYLAERMRERFTDWTEIARACTAIMRTGAVRHPDDPELRSLLDELSDRDPRFARFWEAQGVARRPRSRSTYIHPDVGAMVLDWQILTTSESPDHLIAVISPGDPGPSVEAFRALAQRR